MLAILLLLSFGVNPPSSTSGQTVPGKVIVTGSDKGIYSALLSLVFHPRMTEGQVISLLGPFESASGGAGYMMQWYPRYGVQVFWSLPIRYWAPGERIGPFGMALLRTVPCPLVQGILVPLLAAKYQEPTLLREVIWVGSETITR